MASEIDIDRIDYLMRDAERAGTEFGAVDCVRLIEALEIRRIDGRFRVAPTARARSPFREQLDSLVVWIHVHRQLVDVRDLRRNGRWAVRGRAHGVGWMSQLVPSQRSARVASGNADAPTAVQAVRAVHDTPDR